MNFNQVPCGTNVVITSAVLSLDLSWNSLTNIDKHAFETFTSLASLNLNNNQISLIHLLSLDGLTALKRLTMSNNQIQTIPGGVFANLTLEYLDISHNNVLVVWGSLLEGFSTLKYFDMSYNQIDSVFSGTFQTHANINTIVLNNNRISQIVGMIFIGENLQIVNLANNSINRISSSAFRSSTALLSLDLSYNLLTVSNIRYLPALVALEYLDMSNNKISRLTRLPRGLPNLITLKLNNNAVSYVPTGAFGEGRKIQTLTLNNNAITYIAAKTFSNMTSIRTLMLHGNSLIHFDSDMFTDLDQLTTLSLYPNPLDCCERNWSSTLVSQALLCSTYSLDGISAPTPHCARCGYPSAYVDLTLQSTVASEACAAVSCPAQKPTAPEYSVTDPTCTARGYESTCNISCMDTYKPSSHRSTVWTCLSTEKWTTNIFCQDTLMRLTKTTNEYLQKTYAFSKVRASFWDAEHYCEDRGGNLVSIGSSAEAYTVSAFFERAQTSLYTWIGLYAKPNHEAFAWTTNETVTWTAPMFNSSIHIDSCISMYSTGKVQNWVRSNCTHERNFICEYPMSLV